MKDFSVMAMHKDIELCLKKPEGSPMFWFGLMRTPECILCGVDSDIRYARIEIDGGYIAFQLCLDCGTGYPDAASRVVVKFGKELSNPNRNIRDLT